MKKIELTKGFSAIVDDEDFERLSQYKWCSLSKDVRYAYAVRSEKGKLVLMHRQIMGITDPRILVDHANHNVLDNQRTNLRVCDYPQNLRNIRMHCDNRSGYKGVCYDGRPGRKYFYTQICVGGKRISIGKFDTARAAAFAYDELARVHHGEFALTNF